MFSYYHHYCIIGLLLGSQRDLIALQYFFPLDMYVWSFGHGFTKNIKEKKVDSYVVNQIA